MIIKEEIVKTEQQHHLKNGAIINRFTHVCKGAYIGSNVMIGQGCYIASKAVIGDNTRIQNHVSVWNGVEIGSRVFIGPSVTFTNHHDPSDRFNRAEFKADKTIVGDGATICASAVIIAPCVLDSDCMVGAGSVVLRDIEKNEKVVGLVPKLKYTGHWSRNPNA